MISVKDIQKRYGKLTAVDNINFEVERGGIVGLLGHNGAGKTTIMKIMTGYLEPTRGTIVVGGVDVVTDRLGVQKQIGYMPENAPLYREMLVQEYLMMMAELRGISKAKRVEAVSEAAEATGLIPRLVQPIGQLSKGYRQRVGLAAAILHKPDVLVLDEPTNGLDPVQIVEIRDLIRRLAQTTTVIISTHILSEIEAVCNRVIILIDGRLAADSPLDALLASNVNHLVVESDTQDVETSLLTIDGIESVTMGDRYGNRQSWIIRFAEGGNPAPMIVKTAVQLGWNVHELTSENPSLEQVFRDLMAKHVDQARHGEDAA